MSFTCANHPHVPTSHTCSRCGRPFCDACLTEIMHRPVCGWCRDLEVAQAQAVRSTDPAQIVLWARIYDGLSLLCTGGITGFYGYFFSMPYVFTPRPLPGAAPPPVAPSPMLGFGITGLILAIEMLVFLPPILFLGNRGRWVWYWQMLALVVGVVGGLPFCTSFGLVTIGGAIAIGIFWVKPEVREYFEPPR